MGEPGGHDPGVSRPSWMHALGSRALGEELQRPGRLASRNSEGMYDLGGGKTEQLAGGGGSRERATHASWVKALNVKALRRQAPRGNRQLDCRSLRQPSGLVMWLVSGAILDP